MELLRRLWLPRVVAALLLARAEGASALLRALAGRIGGVAGRARHQLAQSVCPSGFYDQGACSLKCRPFRSANAIACSGVEK